MKKNSKNSSVKSQLPQQQVTQLSSLTLEELESVQGGFYSNFRYKGYGKCRFCWNDDNDGDRK